MPLILRLVLFVFSLVFFFAVFQLVRKERLQLKYSLMWMVLSIVVLLCAVFPNAVGAVSKALGVGVASNFVFLAGFVILIGICLSLSVIVSWQAKDIRCLVQQVALLNKRLEEDDRRGVD
ncbi:MAG: DUF2304 domain-containing protein [Olsenella sp.]|nr:DUF2304 domain-containing protein [Olsenella sp.]